jgi:hypothetical protein
MDQVHHNLLFTRFNYRCDFHQTTQKVVLHSDEEAKIVLVNSRGPHVQRQGGHRLPITGQRAFQLKMI